MNALQQSMLVRIVAHQEEMGSILLNHILSPDQWMQTYKRMQRLLEINRTIAKELQAMETTMIA